MTHNRARAVADAPRIDTVAASNQRGQRGEQPPGGCQRPRVSRPDTCLPPATAQAGYQGGCDDTDGQQRQSTEWLLKFSRQPPSAQPGRDQQQHQRG